MVAFPLFVRITGWSIFVSDYTPAKSLYTHQQISIDTVFEQIKLLQVLVLR